jgi:hypothetical protein
MSFCAGSIIEDWRIYTALQMNRNSNINGGSSSGSQRDELSSPSHVYGHNQSPPSVNLSSSSEEELYTDDDELPEQSLPSMMTPLFFRQNGYINNMPPSLPHASNTARIQDFLC